MLLRNSLWNLSGSAIPMVVALATIPLLIEALGVEGFGIVTMVSSVVGYFGVLDVNLTSGSIKYLAEHHASNDRKRFAETFWFGILFYGVLGVVAASCVLLGAGLLVTRFFQVSPGLVADTVLAFQIGALGFALAQAQNYLLVVPQALQRYDRSAQSEAIFGVLVNLCAVGAAWSGWGIVGVIVARVGVSALNVLYLIWVIRRFNLELTPRWPRADVRNALMHFSAYAYLSKLASTMQQHADKLIVGAVAGPIALAYYSVPVTLAGRILGLTYRLSSVIYPRASALAGAGRIGELRPVYLSVMRYITYINLTALGVIVLAGDEFLRHWVGEQFVTVGYPVLILMTLALLVDSLTNVPSLVNDALGFPRITGRFAVANGICGVAMVYFGTTFAGISGAAAGHLLSSLVMGMGFLIFVHGRSIPVGLRDVLRDGPGRSLLIGSIIICLLLPLKLLLPSGLTGTAIVVTLALIALGVAGLRYILVHSDRDAMLALARRALP